MEKLVFRPNITVDKKFVGRVSVNAFFTLMALGGAGDAEAADCKGATRITVRNFNDIGGVKMQYDKAIDEALDPVPLSKVKISVKDRVVAEGTTDTNGQAVIPVNSECTDSSTRIIEVLGEVTTPDGRKVTEILIVQNGRLEKFSYWFVKPSTGQKPVIAPTSPQGPLPQPPKPAPKPEGKPEGKPAEKQKNALGWLLLPAAALLYRFMPGNLNVLGKSIPIPHLTIKGRKII